MQQVPLKEIVLMYIDESKQATAEFERLWVIAFRGMQELGMDMSWLPKTVLLDVNPNNTVDLPCDYINWIKIGVHNEFGELCLFSVNKGLSNYNSNQDTRLADLLNGPLTPSALSFTNFFLTIGRDGANTISYSRQLYAQVKVDDLNKVIILEPDNQYDQIVLEYMSAPQQDKDFCVELQIQEALLSYLRWKDVISNRNVNLGEKEMRRRVYYNEKRLARMRLKPFRLQDVDDSLRAMRMSPMSSATPSYETPTPPPPTRFYNNFYNNFYS